MTTFLDASQFCSLYQCTDYDIFSCLFDFVTSHRGFQLVSDTHVQGNSVSKVQEIKGLNKLVLWKLAFQDCDDEFRRFFFKQCRFTHGVRRQPGHKNALSN